ncbi:receptor like protein 13 [Abeliophyllum distichum]|uniref:Receptor like protein 13 n=1 Tax=Abeliophyllum distichum TaxID=126358 RepID=A0ABD1UJM5_9LAMI
MVLSFLNGKWYCLGCFEEERIALLHLKENINFPNGISLPSWVDYETKAGCCHWQGVQCSNTTGRVIQLDLDGTRLGDWYFNASLFLPFQELRNLSLGDNNLVGWIENEGFDKLSKLTNLEALDLSGNSFDRNILSSLSQLSSLKHLNLSGTFDFSSRVFETSGHERLSGLKNLQVLDFSGNFGINVIDVLSILELNDFINLRELDISGNQFRSFGTIYGLRNLKVLNLRYNAFNNNIFSSIQGLSSLESLFLDWNEIKGSVQINELYALNDLVELGLSYNEIENFNTSKGIKSTIHSLQVLYLDGIIVSNISNMLQSLRAFPCLKNLYIRSLRYNIAKRSIATIYELRHLSQLEGLFLANSYLDANFLQSIGVMTSLKFLSLSLCGLGGSLPNQGWCELKNLEELDLSYNEFEGILPSCLSNMTYLRYIELSENNFSGNVAMSPLSKITSLEYLSLSSNNFQVPNSFESFFNHSNLRFIYFDNNKVITESETRNWVPNFQLEILSLSNCDLTLPNFLYYQTDLKILDLSKTNIGGNFPNWLLENNTRLRRFYLRENAFTGTLKLPTSTNSALETFEISNNKFNGHIPTNISSNFPNLLVLNMSENVFDGCIPSSIGDLKSLQILDLSNNNLSGTIPQEVVMGCFSLYFFKISKNKIQGQIFPESINVMPLRLLYLDNNEFSGTISNSLSSISTLSALDISNNRLSGKIPTSVGNMTRLRLVSMSNNHLEGPIPVEICKLDILSFLDLSKNNLSGSVASCFNQLKSTHVYLNNNRLESELTHAFNNNSSLVALDLRENQFIGSIPLSIGNLSSLSIILLRRNHFEGTIPDQLCQMKKLSMIDLSYNGLYGHIPHCLGNITLEVRKMKSRSSALGVDITWFTYWSYMVEVISERAYHVSYLQGIERERERESIGLFDLGTTVAFTTKRNLYYYKGRILDYMSGIDLSCNKLYGEIPTGLGKLSELYALNLSHNNLIGTIPETFSNLSQIESLDLSYNNLSGRIPSGLVELKNLEVFTVAHNNLTGIIPQKNQFGTFDKDSYEGNPHLCGRPLPIDCTGSKPVPPFVFDDESEESGFMDMQFFYISFAVSYVSVVICIATVLYINPHWRRAWFHLIEVYIINPFFRLALRSKSCSPAPVGGNYHTHVLVGEGVNVQCGGGALLLLGQKIECGDVEGERRSASGEVVVSGGCRATGYGTKLGERVDSEFGEEIWHE